ncbi:Aste57867_12300 [Aphanomyces stellatus]|uniref:Aste57867_12300 protein n=1 Tax=Aphanomyces stellatus TaxID=120398 RepID=A0A485KX76_9STRA|nr:hypothetical protein As57867_012254 [Aphanomyces stellatus]VFT89153.1 Aste57867_12300 [Aphanomyces stellatus]
MAKLAFLSLLATATANTWTNTTETATLLGSSCSAIQENTDYDGNNLSSTKQLSAELCCADCRANPHCALYVWFQGKCYLKTKAGAKQINARGRRAAFVSTTTTTTLAPPTVPPFTSMCSALLPNTDYEGHDIGAVNREMADQCCDVCKVTPGCALFVHVDQVCWLKSAKGKASFKLGAQASMIDADTPKCGPTEANTDYAGDNLYGSGSAADLFSCCVGCQMNRDCNAYSFVEATQECSLKSGRTGTSAKSGVTSGRVYKCTPIEMGVDYVGNDLADVAADAADDCCALCRNLDGCKAFSYADGTCYLKSDKGATTTNVDVQSIGHPFCLNGFIVVLSASHSKIVFI